MNQRIFTTIVLSCVILFSGTAVSARSINDALGKTSFSWLKSMPDAELAATGECFAGRDGHSGLLVHPAVIAGLCENTAKLSYVSHYVDTQYGSVGIARKYKNKNIGLRISYVNYGDFTETSRQGERLGTFSAGDIGISFNIGKTIRPDLKIGVIATYLSSKLDDFSAQAFSVDLGAIYEPPFEGLTVGATLMNVGTITKSYSSGYDETLPVMLVIGGVKKLQHAPISLMADVRFPNDNDPIYCAGIEFNVNDTFYLRAGARSRNKIDSEIMRTETDYGGYTSYGFGLNLRGYRFNYAFCPDDLLEDVHKITLGVRMP